MTIIATVTKTVTRTYGADLTTFNVTCASCPGLTIGPVDTQNELAACDAADTHNLEAHPILAMYTDQILQHHIDDPKAMPGDKNSAPYLLKLENEELRSRASSRAYLRSNLVGGRRSENVYYAVEETLRIGLAESRDELFARESRYRDHVARCYLTPQNCDNPAHEYLRTAGV